MVGEGAGAAQERSTPPSAPPAARRCREAVAALDRDGGPASRRREGLLDRVPATREARADGFVAAYRHYCWPVESLADLKLAPFHLLATEGGVHADRDHVWHMETLADGLRAPTRSCCWRRRTGSST